MSKHLCFGWVGDSLTEGYGDGVVISCNGVSGRFLRFSIGVQGEVSTIHVNMGVSGRLVHQYIDVAKSIIDADPTRYSAILTSIWSPNIPAGEVAGYWPTRPENLNSMITALESFEQFLLDRSIVFMPTFMGGSPYATTYDTQVALQEHVDFCTNKWPWLLNFNTPIQSPIVSAGPYIDTSRYCDDATHPNIAGYDAQYAWGSSRLMPAFEQACTAYGFVEAG